MPKVKKKKYDPPKTRKIEGRNWRLTAASRQGVPKGDAEYNKEYLKGLGFKTRRFKVGRYYYVYAIKK